MFEAIVVLRQQLSPDQHLEVVHAGHVWRASFQWSQPTSNSEVLDIQSQLDKPLLMTKADFVKALPTCL